MGRRKERRLAAMSAAGRRVKLDLFAEPSGDVGGSSAQDEVGEDGDSKSHSELPTSPSSSGQKPQNPLLLLGQYSDEELDEGSSDGHDNAALDGTSVDIDDEEKAAGGTDAEDAEDNARNETLTEKVEEFLMELGSTSEDLLEEHVIANDSHSLLRGTNQTEEAANPALPDEQLVGDLRSGWKMVLHEESNQYYYWNITTGETSWEIPTVLAQGTVVNSVDKAGDTEERKDEVMGTHKSGDPLDTEDNITTGKPNGDSVGNGIDSEIANQGTKVGEFNQGCEGGSFSDVDGNGDANQNHGTSLLDEVPVMNGTKLSDAVTHFEDSKIGSNLPVQLEKHCENMLERLSSVKGSTRHMDGQDLKLKFALEIETRLADIRALASHGRSLLPFWLHTDNCLKRLDSAIAGVIQQCHTASLSEYEATLKSHEGSGEDAENTSKEKASFAAVESHALENIVKESNFEARDDGPPAAEQLPSALCVTTTDHVNDAGDKGEINGIETEGNPSPRPALHSGEDVDMDVDMEVEDTSNSASGAESSELAVFQNTLVNKESAMHGASGPVFSAPLPVENWVPPPPHDNEPFPPLPPDNEPFPPLPPDNEPFPPPPPDDEPFPPPPPDEPPETSSSYSESISPFPYSEQYPLSYTGPSLEYYGQTHPEISSAGFYTNSDGAQVPISHLPHYYEAVSNMYAVAPLVINPVGPNAYYGLQNGNVNPISVVGGAAVESCGTQSEPFPGNKVSDTEGTLDFHAEGGYNLSQNTSANVMNADNGAMKGPLGVAGAQPTMAASSTSSVRTTVSVPSTSNATSSNSATVTTPGPATAPAATSKVQSKVPRIKKRNVATVSTLKSNKKVSSLVDKWKAAKEELHEEEEEPENAYEVLEKKRQREIEEWRAQQIASGEAKDNANFQPLGGDWRERVKRKRAEKMKETKQSLSDVATDGKQQPDLVELSKGLPSGWQAYWDDSSKQVYFGNVLTAETTWTRPAD